jgi:hypothetical protein
MAGCRKAAEGRCPKCHRRKGDHGIAPDETTPA